MNGQSKYAVNRASRFSMGGRSFKSLGEGQISRIGAEKAINPMPRPLDFDYIPKHTPKFQSLPGPEPMKHEDSKMVSRFRNKDFRYPGPRKAKLVKTVAYDHYKMNYAGGPTDNPDAA